MKITLLIILIGFFSSDVYNQCSYKNTTFGSNEKISYEIYYNWGLIWLNAGEASLEIQDTSVQNKPAYHLISTGHTYKNYDWLYKVRDRFESIIDSATLTPHYFSRITEEGGYKVNNSYKFNSNSRTIESNTWNSESLKKKKTLSFNDCTFDVLSAIYACRTINFNSKTINDTVPLSIIIDGEIFNLYIRYLGKETIVNRDNRQFNCNKFSILLVEGTIFKGGEDMFVWVSNDENQIPVYVEAKILVGSVKAMVKDIDYTKWPSNYQIFSTSDQ